jgi:hypothetical protein
LTLNLGLLERYDNRNGLGETSSRPTTGARPASVLSGT